MKRTLTLTWVAACLAGICATPALAASSASASLSAFSYQLFDLNPTDGIAPSLTWTADTNSFVSRTSGQVSDSNGQAVDSFQQTANGLFSPVSGQASTPLGSVRGSVAPGSGPDPFTGATLSAAGQTLGSSAAGLQSRYFATANADYSPATNPFIPTLFSVSPFTLVVFSAQSALAATTTFSFDAASNGSEVAFATTTLTVGGTGGSAGQTFVDTDSIAATPIGDGSVLHGQSLVRNDTLAASFTNLGNTVATGYFSASAEVNGATNLPIPEPETYALMLAGLGLLARLTRSRRTGLSSSA